MTSTSWQSTLQAVGINKSTAVDINDLYLPQLSHNIKTASHQLLMVATYSCVRGNAAQSFHPISSFSSSSK